MSRASVVFLASLLFALHGCGGGGGGSSTIGSGPSGGTPQPPEPPAVEPGAFTLAATSVHFDAKDRGPLPAPQTIALEPVGGDIATVEPISEDGLPYGGWLDVEVEPNGFDYLVVFTVIRTDLGNGVQGATVTIGTKDGAGNVLQTQDVEVTFNVWGGIVIATQPQFLEATLGHSTHSFTRTVSVLGESLDWRLSSDVPWITFPEQDHSGNADIQVTIDTSTLSTGTHVGQLNAVNTENPDDDSTLEFTVVVQDPVWAPFGVPITFGGNSGIDLEEQVLNATLSTGTNEHAWTASFIEISGGNWLEIVDTSGTVSQAGTNIRLRPLASTLEQGIYEGTLRLQATVNGRSIATEFSARLRVAEQRLWVSANGVGFSALPGRSVLERQLQVFNSRARDIEWHASSDVDWLTVTASGDAQEPLILTADPAGLAVDQLHFATVTVAANDPLIHNQEAIRVALWIGATDPQDETIPFSAKAIAANPVEPHLFAHAGADIISVYHAHSGDQLRTLSVDGALGAMTFSSDGLTLFVLRADGTEALAIEPDTGEVLRTYRNWHPRPNGRLTYARPEGHAILMSGGDGAIFDANSAERFPLSLFPPGSIVVSHDGRRVFIQETTGTPSRLNMIELRYSSLDPAGISFGRHLTNQGNQINVTPDGKDIALTSSGLELYRANHSVDNFGIVSSETLASVGALAAELHPVSIECGWRGVCVGGTSGQSSTQNIWIYDEQGASLGGHTVGSAGVTLEPAELVFSGDNTRAAVATSEGLVLLTLP